MKKSTERIVDNFPMFKQKLLEKQYVYVKEEEFQSLDHVQQTFFKLACFFENPGVMDFNLADLYKHLDDDWLEFALELITLYFREDTFLIKKPSFSLIKDGSEFLNLSQFANFLTEQGLKYDRQKVNLYLERGKIPEPDLLVGGTKYWSNPTVSQYCKSEMKRLGVEKK